MLFDCIVMLTSSPVNMTVVIASRLIRFLTTVFYSDIRSGSYHCLFNNGVGFGPAPSQSPAW
jgi:hypothetical protein